MSAVITPLERLLMSCTAVAFLLVIVWNAGGSRFAGVLLKGSGEGLVSGKERVP